MLSTPPAFLYTYSTIGVMMYNVGLGREPSSRKVVQLQSPPGCTLSGVAAPPPNARGWKPGRELEVLSVPALVLAATQPVRLFVLRFLSPVLRPDLVSPQPPPAWREPQSRLQTTQGLRLTAASRAVRSQASVEGCVLEGTGPIRGDAVWVFQEIFQPLAFNFKLYN